MLSDCDNDNAIIVVCFHLPLFFHTTFICLLILKKVFPEIENFPRIHLVQKEYKKWEKETYNVLKYVSGRCTSHFLLVSAHNHD